jgi:putative membrane protein
MSPADPARQSEPTDHEREPDYRFTLANERTFLAWIRTALALIAGGVAMVQLVPAFGLPGIRHALGVVLTAGGGILAALGVRRWSVVQTAMRRGADLPPSRLPIFLGVAILAVTVLILVVLLTTPSTGQ